VDHLSLMMIVSGYLVSGAATHALGVDGTNFSIELGFLEADHNFVKAFPYVPSRTRPAHCYESIKFEFEKNKFQVRGYWNSVMLQVRGYRNSVMLLVAVPHTPSPLLQVQRHSTPYDPRAGLRAVRDVQGVVDAQRVAVAGASAYRALPDPYGAGNL
jgi:hypothetical protein